MSDNERPGCMMGILQALGLRSKPAPSPEGPSSLPYRLIETFLSEAELNFYHVLRQLVGDRAIICPKVGLGDLFRPKTGDRSQKATYRNKIDRKHVDFLLCEPATMKPLAGLELDDASHQRSDRIERDTFVDQVFAAAGLPLLHFPVQAAYAPRDLAGKLRNSGLDLSPVADTPVGSQAAVPSTPTAPVCPRCHIPMVLRTGRRPGANYGKQFYGCSNYPQCRETVPLRGPTGESVEGPGE